MNTLWYIKADIQGGPKITLFHIEDLIENRALFWTTLYFSSNPTENTVVSCSAIVCCWWSYICYSDIISFVFLLSKLLALILDIICAVVLIWFPEIKLEHPWRWRVVSLPGASCPLYHGALGSMIHFKKGLGAYNSNLVRKIHVFTWE